VTRWETALFPHADRRRDHFPVLCIGAAICSTFSLI
jgi:hypothetical protein